MKNKEFLIDIKSEITINTRGRNKKPMLIHCSFVNDNKLDLRDDNDLYESIYRIAMKVSI